MDFVREVSNRTGWSMRVSRDWVRRVIRTEAKDGRYDKEREEYRVAKAILVTLGHPRLVKGHE